MIKLINLYNPNYRLFIGNRWQLIDYTCFEIEFGKYPCNFELLITDIPKLPADSIESDMKMNP